MLDDDHPSSFSDGVGVGGQGVVRLPVDHHFTATFPAGGDLIGHSADLADELDSHGRKRTDGVAFRSRRLWSGFDPRSRVDGGEEPVPPTIREHGVEADERARRSAHEVARVRPAAADGPLDH